MMAALLLPCASVSALQLAVRPLLRSSAPTCHVRLRTRYLRGDGIAWMHSPSTHRYRCSAMGAMPAKRVTSHCCTLVLPEDEKISANDVLATEKPPRFQLKYIVLLILVFHNSATTMLVRYTRIPRPSAGPLYLGPMAVLISELLKFPTCLALIARDEGGFRGMVREGRKPPPSTRLHVPPPCCLAVPEPLNSPTPMAAPNVVQYVAESSSNGATRSGCPYQQFAMDCRMLCFL